jgi:hypothetical protein
MVNSLTPLQARNSTLDTLRLTAPDETFAKPISKVSFEPKAVIAVGRQAPYFHHERASGSPSFRNNQDGGQKPVKADCSRFTPMEAVNSRNQGDTK